MEDNRLPENRSTEKRDGLEGRQLNPSYLNGSVSNLEETGGRSWWKGPLAALLIVDEKGVCVCVCVCVCARACVYRLWRGFS